MSKLYIECKMGAAGDMLMAALMQCLPRPGVFVDQMHALFPDVEIEPEPICCGGIVGMKVHVRIQGQEEGTAPDSRNDTAHAPFRHETGRGILGNLNIPVSVKRHALAIYDKIAQAESHVHGVPVGQIHFTRLGDMDAVVDIIASCILLDMLAPEHITVSPIHVGKGSVQVRDFSLPVPTPATAFILKDVPTYSGDIQGELCTPTGAAILTHFAGAFAWDLPNPIHTSGNGLAAANLICPAMFVYTRHEA